LKLVVVACGACLSTALAVLLIVAVSFAIIQPYNKYILSGNQFMTNYADVGLVLGAGITEDGKPFKELQSRLDGAAAALKNGKVHQLILSGDNRFDSYDEPTAMKKYLMERYGISASVLHPDFAGRSTYESCQRVAQIFGQEHHKVVIFSAGSHLPRAIYLCRHFGVDAYGVPSTIEANNATRRELLARVKAVYNVYVRGENTILGPAELVEGRLGFKNKH
jgi:vancomycin permeability regulator SanA